MIGWLSRVAALCVVGSAWSGTGFIDGRRHGGDLTDRHLGQAEPRHRTDQQSNPREWAIAAHHRRLAGGRMIEGDTWFATHAII